MSTTIHALIISVVVLVFVFEYYKYHRSRVHLSLIRRGDIDVFLREIDKDIDRYSLSDMSINFLISKSAGLCYKGRFDDAIELLCSFDVNKLIGINKSAYYNNMVSALLLSGKIDEANRLHAEQRECLEPDTKIQPLSLAMKSTQATLDFFNGNLAKSRDALAELSSTRLLDVDKAQVFYFLGMIDLKENRVHQAHENFAKARALGPATFVPGKIDEINLMP